MTNMEAISRQYRQRAGLDDLEAVAKTEKKADAAQAKADAKAEKAEAAAEAE